MTGTFRHKCLCGIEYQGRKELVLHIRDCGQGHDVDVDANREFLSSYYNHVWAASAQVARAPALNRGY